MKYNYIICFFSFSFLLYSIDFSKVQKSTVFIEVFPDAENFYRENLKSLNQSQKQLLQLMINQKSMFVLSQGTGFPVKQDGYILSNEHLLHRPHPSQYKTFILKVLSSEGYKDFLKLYSKLESEIQVEFNRGSGEKSVHRAKARIIYTDILTDLAILHIDEETPFFLEIGGNQVKKTENPFDNFIGVNIFVAGFPHGLSFKCSFGRIRGIETLLDKDYIDFDATLDRGNSGGPLFESNSLKVIGIATSVKGRASNFAIPYWLYEDKVFSLTSHYSFFSVHRNVEGENCVFKTDILDSEKRNISDFFFLQNRNIKIDEKIAVMSEHHLKYFRNLSSPYLFYAEKKICDQKYSNKEVFLKIPIWKDPGKIFQLLLFDQGKIFNYEIPHSRRKSYDIKLICRMHRIVC